MRLDESLLARLNVRISAVSMLRLKQACIKKGNMDAAFVSYGRMLSDLIMKYLPPHPSEQDGKKKSGSIGRQKRIAA